MPLEAPRGHDAERAIPGHIRPYPKMTRRRCAYPCSPALTFCLLVPPQLDPEFDYNDEALRAMQRAPQKPDISERVEHNFGKEIVAAKPAPITRLRGMARMTVYGEAVKAMPKGDAAPGTWEHDLRDATWENGGGKTEPI